MMAAPVSVPAAFAALGAFPWLQRPFEASVAAHTALIAERLAGFVPRPDVVAALDQQLRALPSGLIALQGAPGAGATSMLCWLAANRPYLLWLPDADPFNGLHMLCAQILARYRLPLPLVPPAAARDAATLERLLHEAAQTPRDEPIVVLVGPMPAANMLPFPLPFPRAIPDGVLLVHACGAQPPPFAPAATVELPRAGAALAAQLLQAAHAGGSDPADAQRIADAAAGSFGYVRLASSLSQTGMIKLYAAPDLRALHAAWWRALDDPGQRLACVLAAAGEAMPLDLAAAASGLSLEEARHHGVAWGALLGWRGDDVALDHASMRAFILDHSPAGVRAAHHAIVAHAGGEDRLHTLAEPYGLRQLARHVALGEPDQAASMLPQFGQRWAEVHERPGGETSATAAAWLLRAARAAGSAVPLVQAAMLAGTQTTMSRSLPVEGLASAFGATLAAGYGRDDVLRRAQALVDQLPEGRRKAQALRRLGEACHDAGMRGPAMRMLAAALDNELPELPRAWRDEREETLVAFAHAAIAAGAPDLALGITTRITHRERRGMIETDVVRAMLAANALTRAEEVAYAINHPSTHEWAMAEVALAHARAGNRARAGEVLGTLKTPTAVAWAVGELSCDAARHGHPDAAAGARAISNAILRDRALAQVALALVAGQLPDQALATAEQIADPDVYMRAMIDIALLQPPNALQMLDQAAAALARLETDLRAPVIVALATAYAHCGHLPSGIRAAHMLQDEEVRYRAYSRMAAALAQRGDHTAAAQLASAIPDDDERFWTLHELARLQTHAGNWPAALGLVAEIAEPALGARAAADVAIIRARAGEAQQASAYAASIGVPSEQLRALGAIAGPLVQAGHAMHAAAMFDMIGDVDTRSRYAVALVAALAAAQHTAAAHAWAARVERLPDRMRSFVAVARTLTQRPDEAMHMLGEAFQIAAELGRTETLNCLTLAAEPLLQATGAETLLAAAHALDEVDSWWN